MRLPATSRQWLAIPVALCAALFISYLLKIDVFTRIDSITWNIAHEQNLRVSVSHQKRYPDKIITHGWMALDRAPTNGISRAEFDLNNYPVAYFTTRLQGADAKWEIKSIVLRSSFGKDIVLSGDKILRWFFAPSANTDLSFEDGRVFVTGTDQTAEIFSKRFFEFHNPIIKYGLPAVVGLLVWLLVSFVSLKNVPSFRLLDKQHANKTGHSLELDGLRGLAAISVVADHTWGLFTGSGLAGVWIFFALSGYLLSIPFVRQPERIFQGQYVMSFYIRRLARIVPMYYVILFIYYMASGAVFSAIPHFLFLQGDGHFWTITQEMLFYLFLPVILLAMAMLIRISFMFAVMILAAVMIWLLLDIDAIPITLHSTLYERPAFIGWFLAGVLVSYCLNRENFLSFLKVSSAVTIQVIGVAALVVMFAMFLFGSTHYADLITGADRSFAHTAKSWYALGAAFLIFAAVTARNSLYGAFLRWTPLRSFGILGYSAYLIHPLLLDIILKFAENYHFNLPPGYFLFFTTLVFTWIVSTLTYNLIEHPFLSYRVQLQKNPKTD